MNPSTSELLRQGLSLTVIGMGLVFGALALVWGIIALLGRVFASEVPTCQGGEPDLPPAGDDAGKAALTAERARVAAIVAGALMANALPLRLEPSPGPTFEHGRTAPAWVTTSRARVMRPWQPPRATDDRR